MAAAVQDQPIWQRLTVRHLLLLTPWIGVVVGASRPIRDNSFLWHIRAGTLQLEAGEVLTTDPFSYTMAGEPWRTQSWLADLLYGWLEQSTGGLAWVPLLLIMSGGLVLALVAATTFRRVSDPLPVALTLVALVWLGLPNLVPRPVIFSFVLLALLVVVLDLRADWVAPVILWVWAGVHGSFVLGIGLLVLDALRRRLPWKTASVRLAASVVAVSLTAHGLGVWSVLASFLANRGALDFISEWAAPDLLSISVAPYVLIIVAVMAALAGGRITGRELWVVVPFLVFGLTSSRAIMPATIVLVPFAASIWVPRSAGDSTQHRSASRLNLAIAVTLILVPLVAVAGFDGIDEQRFPVQATKHLTADRVWHDDATGGYLIYLARLPVFIDDRAELFGEDFFRDFLATRRGTPVWRTVFERFDIQQALTESESGIAAVLATEGWSIKYADDRWMVLTRP